MRKGKFITPATRREREIAGALGVTPKGLAVLGLADANAGGLLKRTLGSASLKLAEQGYIIRHPNAAAGSYGGHVITEAGRAIVRRARAMGW
jgi:hypothetical protein